MTYLGHVSNGQILLDEPALLPEGTAVKIEVVAASMQITRPRHRDPLEEFQPIELPGDSLADEIVRDRR